MAPQFARFGHIPGFVRKRGTNLNGESDPWETSRVRSAPRPGGLLQPAKAVLDLLLVLRLGQLSLSDLNQLGRDCGLEKALDEAHEFSKVNMGTVHSTIVAISNSGPR
jgi:hypothetical protein